LAYILPNVVVRPLRTGRDRQTSEQP